MEFNFLNISSIIYNAILVLLIVFILTINSKRKQSNYILATYFFLQSFDMAAQYIGHYIYPKYPALGLLLSQMIFLQIPLFYLFIKSSVFYDFKVNYKSFIHLFTFIFAIAITFPFYYLKIFKGETITQSDFSDMWINKFGYLLIYLQLAFYYILIYLLLRKYKSLLIDNYSNIENQNYNWLYQFFLIQVIIVVLSLVKNLFRFYMSDFYYDLAQNILAMLALCFIGWLMLKALKNPHLFYGIYSGLQLTKSNTNVSEQSKQITEPDKSNYSEQENNIQLNNLLQYMELNKPYLNASLSLSDLSNQTKIPERELSSLINNNLNKHFFDFVNEYRINKAISILKNPDLKHLTILEILYEVGFNSKSSFNTAFKKFTDSTPTGYRRKYLSGEV